MASAKTSSDEFFHGRRNSRLPKIRLKVNTHSPEDQTDRPNRVRGMARRCMVRARSRDYRKKPASEVVAERPVYAEEVEVARPVTKKTDSRSFVSPQRDFQRDQWRPSAVSSKDTIG
jgi:hypothetical protein